MCVDCSQMVPLPDGLGTVRLGDLGIIATLGVGGFGRVELVR